MQTLTPYSEQKVQTGGNLLSPDTVAERSGQSKATKAPYISIAHVLDAYRFNLLNRLQRASEDDYYEHMVKRNLVEVLVSDLQRDPWYERASPQISHEVLNCSERVLA